MESTTWKILIFTYPISNSNAVDEMNIDSPLLQFQAVRLVAGLVFVNLNCTHYTLSL